LTNNPARQSSPNARVDGLLLSREDVLVKNPFNLQRFIDAQDPEINDVLSELRAGRKTSHWMWFIFPQIQGLGRTAVSKEFAISSLAEAKAYLEHPVLGPRLRECASLVASITGSSSEEIFGYPDYLKFRSSMTLFARATPDNKIFLDVLKKYYHGELDPLTLQLLANQT
jgi:uncharacterized protein (DUF1810 family)